MTESEGTSSTRTRSSRRGRSQRTRRRDKVADGPSQGELLPDGKLYYRIGEVAQITGVKPHVLRYWETEFRGMVPPKSRSKQRLYRRKDIEMVLAIKRLLYDERYTIAGARQQLREIGLAKALETTAVASAESPSGSASADETGERPVADVPMSASASEAAISELRTGYRRIRSELEAIRDML